MASAAPAEEVPPPLAAPAPYTRGPRDLRVDLMRGAAIFAMVVDHVGGDRSPLYVITGGDKFYVSAAEAFVFLAGVVAGMVYGPIAARRGGVAAARLLKRAGIIYAWTAVLTLVTPFIAAALHLGWESPLRDLTPLQFVVSVLTVHRTYHLMDVLLLYVLLFGAASALIVWMVDGHTRIVLICSWAFWITWQTAADSPAPWDIQAMNVFQFATWQALFFTGVAIGIHRHRLRFLGTDKAMKIMLIVGTIGFGGCIASYQLRLVNKTFGAYVASHVVSKSDLGIGRLVVFTFLCLFVISLATLAWRYVNALLGWLLIPLGQHSLAAYILHVAVVMAMTKVSLIVFGGDTGPAENTLLQIAGVLAVWGLVHGLTALRSARYQAGVAPRLAAVLGRRAPQAA